MNHLRGYTLVELIVVIAITTLTIIATTAAIIIFYRSNSTTLNEAYAVESARQGIEKTVADIRGIQYGADGSYPVSAIATSSFTFYSNVDDSNTPEWVQYYLSGTTFVRGTIVATGSPPTYPVANESTTTISKYVRNGLENIPIFQYFNASSTQITTYSTTTAVAYVTVELVVNENTSTSTGDYILRSTAALRNASQF
ncbi:MAG: prepilin-type N-terminal cleavage/methylation domain-containing protein [Patescibacteria group bacterium]|nr:prepilin-type N-terminal cleavage/methylation domain-containing protein [Patescibacteria group bacterium]